MRCQSCGKTYVRKTPPAAPGTRSAWVWGGFLAVLLLAGYLGLRVWRSAAGDAEGTLQESTPTVPPDGMHSGTLKVTGRYDYAFTVTALDGAVGMFVIPIRSENALSDAEKKTLLQSLARVEPGATRTMTGRFEPGRYAWGVLNFDRIKAARVRIRLDAK